MRQNEDFRPAASQAMRISPAVWFAPEDRRVVTSCMIDRDCIRGLRQLLIVRSEASLQSKGDDRMPRLAKSSALSAKRALPGCGYSNRQRHPGVVMYRSNPVRTWHWEVRSYIIP